MKSNVFNCESLLRYKLNLYSSSVCATKQAHVLNPRQEGGEKTQYKPVRSFNNTPGPISKDIFLTGTKQKSSKFFTKKSTKLFLHVKSELLNKKLDT